jgi:protein ImuA
MSSVATDLHRQNIRELRERLGQVTSRGGRSRRRLVSADTGIAALTSLFPGDGLRPGSLLEWLSAERGSGTGGLVWRLLAHVMRATGTLVVVDPGGGFYAPAVAALGIDLERVTVVRPGSRADVLWTLEQALRCCGVSGVVCPLEQVNDREFRRLQLAAEAGDNFGMLLRPSRMCGRSSWADLRLEVSPLLGNVSEPGVCPHFVSGGRRLRVELLHCRQGTAGGVVDLELCDATGDLRVVPLLAAATAVRRAAGA